MLIRKMKLEIRKKNFRRIDKAQNVLVYFLFLFSFFFSLTSNAQCAMCRASLESSGNVSQAEAVNDGIVYLMVIPYVLVVLVGWFIYKMYTKKK
jgi:amino acid transporter